MKNIGVLLFLFFLCSQASYAASPVAASQSISCAPNVTGLPVTSCSITLSATGGTAPLTYTVVTNPSNGTLTGTAPAFLYTPTTDYWGTDSFTFKATDSQGNVSAATTISIIDGLIVDTDNVQDFTASYNGSSCASSWIVSHSNWGDFFWGNSFFVNQSYPYGNSCHGVNEYVTFTATIPENGLYDVYMAVPAGYGSAATSNVPVDVNSYYGVSSGQSTTTVPINEQGGGWVDVGRFPFNAQQQANVKIRTDNTSGYILVNAIKFSYVKPVPSSVPPQPTGLSASLLWESAQLSWSAVDASSDGIYIEQSTDGINFTQIIDPLALELQPLSSNQILYYTPPLSAGTTYYYRIRTYNMLGFSPYSDTVSVTTPPVSTTGLIPSDRTIDWSHAGVPGGIPVRTTICADVTKAPYNADKTGNVDAGPAIQLAISGNNLPSTNPNSVPRCPANQVVYIPAGTYLIKTPVAVLSGNDGDIYASQPLTIRGDGPGKTILIDDRTAGQALFEFGDENASSPSPITNGYTKGSNSITVPNASGVQAGMLLKIIENNDPALVFSTGGYNGLLRQTVYVTGVTGNTITFTPSLYWTYDPALDPSFEYITPVLTFSGIEDLTISHPTGTGLLNSAFFDGTYGCWIKNVESDNDSSYHFIFDQSVSGEIQGVFINGQQGTGPDHGGVVFYTNTDNFLVDDNIMVGVFPSLEISSGSSGDVFSYNYSDYQAIDGGAAGFLGTDDDTNHGPHTMMNLWEGNRGIMFMSDGYFGSASHTTAFRNWFTGTDSDQSMPTAESENRKAVGLDRWSYYFNFIGNVLGEPDFNDGSTQGIYDITYPYGYGQPVIYQLGFPNMGNNGYSGINPPVIEPASTAQALDLKVRYTLLRHGNFDYVTNSTIWDPTISNKTLPPSLYLTVAPVFFGNKPWPLIGPDVTGLVAGNLPAQDRYNAVTAPKDPDTTAPTVPFALTAAVSGTQVNLSWEISWDNVGVAGYKVYRDGVFLASVDNSLRMNTQYADTGASAGPHSYTLSAYDAAGNESAQSPAAVVSVASPSGGALGDVNGDGHVTIYDAELTAQYAVGIPVANFNTGNAEVDGTGRVDIYDAYLIAEYALGIINRFPVQQ